VFHTGAGRFFLCFRPLRVSQPFLRTPSPSQTEHHDLEGSSLLHTISWGFIKGGVYEEEDKPQNEAEAGLRALRLLWRSWRSVRLPTRQWACTPPPRSTSVPVNGPLTQASARLSDTRLSQEINRWSEV
jgi:hypothetical protein